MNRSWGVILLAIWLALYGVLAVTNVTVVFANVALGFLAIAAAICLLIGK